ncbi:unnamed protein product [Durusdinium trenchii]|uniref:TRM5/TYW2-like methyltransferase domain-containing protein n=1 Tax=Durusdinium trenchii TaxID=1381693 RepID=A0ABP0MLY6_9DINO
MATPQHGPARYAAARVALVAELLVYPEVRSLGQKAFGDLRKADLALRKAQLLKLRDGEVDLELLFPPDDPEAASECSQTFASDAYGLRRWARQDSQDAGAAEEGLEGEGLGGLGQPAVVDVGANVGCWSIFAAKVMKAQVVAVEPSRHAAFYLACNVRLNRIEPQVTLMNVAMVPRDCTGQMQVFCNPGTSDVQGGSVLDMLHQSCNDDEDHDVVEGVDLESLLEKTRSSTHRLYLRMNCEGCEVWTLGELGPGTLRGIAKISVEAFGHEPKHSVLLAHPAPPRMLQLLCSDAVWPKEQRHVAPARLCSVKANQIALGGAIQ